MRKFLILIFLVFATGLMAQQIPFTFWAATGTVAPPLPVVTYESKPASFQLFQRNADDSSVITVSGILTGLGYDSVGVRILRNGVKTSNNSSGISYSGTSALFSLNPKIKAELALYDLEFYATYGVTQVDIATFDSLVSGDVYIINGQSNAQASDLNVTYSSVYARTFGVQTDSANVKFYNAADTLWHTASANYDYNTSLYSQSKYNVGVIGMWLAKQFIDSLGIPVAIINGSKWGLSIRSHQVNPSNRTDLKTYYGKLLYRMQKASLADKVKAIIWYQGESDIGSSSASTQYDNRKGYTGYAGYGAAFDTLYRAWLTDYPALEKVYVMQVRPLTCYAFGDATAKEFRELQRQLEFRPSYPKVQVVATVGITGYGRGAANYSIAPYCHYHYTGYQQIAQILYHNIGTRFAGLTDTANIKPPSIRKAFFTDTLKTKIGMTFWGSNPTAIPVDSLGYSVKRYFFLNNARTASGVDSLTLSSAKDTMFLWLSTATTATRLGYIPNSAYNTSDSCYIAPFIRNPKGLGMLTFNDVVIYEKESVGIFSRMTTFSDADSSDRVRLVLMDSLVKRLKANSVFNRTDGLYFYANKDTASAHTNWASGALDSFRCVPEGVTLPFFEVDKGYTATNGYLNTYLIPQAVGRYFRKLKGGFSVYCATNISDFNKRPFGVQQSSPSGVPSDTTNNYLGISPRGNLLVSNSLYSNIGDVKANVVSPFINTNSIGLYTVIRSDTNTATYYKDASALGVWAQQYACNVPNTRDYVYVGAYNEKGVASYFYTGRVGVFRIGGEWNSTQTGNFYLDVNWYLTKVGGL